MFYSCCLEGIGSDLLSIVPCRVPLLLLDEMLEGRLYEVGDYKHNWYPVDKSTII